MNREVAVVVLALAGVVVSVTMLASNRAERVAAQNTASAEAIAACWQEFGRPGDPFLPSTHAAHDRCLRAADPDYKGNMAHRVIAACQKLGERAMEVEQCRALAQAN
jgi:hypothetical protein